MLAGTLEPNTKPTALADEADRRTFVQQCSLIGVDDKGEITQNTPF